MSPNTSQPNLTREQCHEVLRQSTFRFQPPDYGKKYPKWPGAVGLEIEMFPVQLKGDQIHTVPMYSDTGAQPSIAGAIRTLAAVEGGKAEFHPDLPGEKLARVVLDKGDNITFEPGGQVEFSSVPYPCLEDAVTRMRGMLGNMRKSLMAAGIEPVQMGVNPWHSPEQIGLQVPKSRYRAMDEYFTEIGPYGRKMMRSSATVQVNLDFGDSEAVLAKRYLLSQLLAPVSAATFSYSPFQDGRKAEVPAFRTKIWRHVDPARTGFPKGLERVAKELSHGSCIETYLDYLLAAPVIFVAANDYQRAPAGVTFGHWLDNPIAGFRPDLSDLNTHMSLLFPEVRPRGFLELRSIDCQAEAWQEVPAAYFTGLLYDEQSCDGALELLLPILPRLDQVMDQATHGMGDASIVKLAQQVMELAVSGFERLPPCFKEPRLSKALPMFADTFTARGTNPGQELYRQVASQGDWLSLSALRRIEDCWSQALN